METTEVSPGGIAELDAGSAGRVCGGMMAVVDDGTGNKARHARRAESGFGALDQPYWDSPDSMRFGAGPWDYGYGSPTGPWP